MDLNSKFQKIKSECRLCSNKAVLPTYIYIFHRGATHPGVRLGGKGFGCFVSNHNKEIYKSNNWYLLKKPETQIITVQLPELKYSDSGFYLGKPCWNPLELLDIEFEIDTLENFVHFINTPFLKKKLQNNGLEIIKCALYAETQTMQSRTL